MEIAKNIFKKLSFVELAICFLCFLIALMGEKYLNTEFFWFFGLFPALIIAYKFGLRGGQIYALLAVLIKGAEDIWEWQEGNISTGEFAIVVSDLIAVLVISIGIGYLTDRLKAKNQQLAQANYRLQELVDLDGITNLANHRAFQSNLNEKLSLARRQGVPVALIKGDIDFFKKYNTDYGYAAGDQVLITIAALLKSCKRSDMDCTARYGGEEFAIILWNCRREEAYKLAEKLRREIEASPIKGKETQPTGKLTMSFGVAAYPQDATNKEDLLQIAESALMQAKVASKNRVGTYYSVIYALSNTLNKSEQEVMESLKSLINIINAKDSYTYAHSERVAKYCTLIGRKLGLSEREITLLEIGGSLHDIGKIELPEIVLKKQGPLSESEWLEMKRHPEIGADLITSVDILKNCRDIILLHHERYDGKGYPAGLKGEDIPLLARIAILADSFDAMTTDRPYRRGKTLIEAIKEIDLCAGTQFDPQLVEVFKVVLAEEATGLGISV